MVPEPLSRDQMPVLKVIEVPAQEGWSHKIKYQIKMKYKNPIQINMMTIEQLLQTPSNLKLVKFPPLHSPILPPATGPSVPPPQTSITLKLRNSLCIKTKFKTVKADVISFCPHASGKILPCIACMCWVLGEEIWRNLFLYIIVQLVNAGQKMVFVFCWVLGKS